MHFSLRFLSFCAPCFALAGCFGDADSDTATAPEGSVGVVGRCDYTNPFSRGPECKEYAGSGWTAETASADCAAPVVGGEAGTFESGAACSREAYIGECVVGGETPDEVVIVFPGTDPEACGGAEMGCGFSQGEFRPSEVCTEPSDPGVPSNRAFVPFQQVCVDPIEGEAPGQGPDGQVCTWQAISGCTEEGRKYADYASCDPVYSQRPYWSSTVSVETDTDDPRLTNEAYLAELAWVTAQVEASACVCCHTAEHAPNNKPSGWFLESSQLWLDGLDDDGLAVMAGWVDSTAFGAFDAEANNGFHRDVTGVPTTNPERMRGFLTDELGRRGLTQADFEATEPFGGPLYDQLFYEPSECTADQGISDEGVIRWTGGPIRYLYILEAGSQSPGVPPNLDFPEGTLWRLDLDYAAEPIATGQVVYSNTPEEMRQTWPSSGEPESLVPGQTYYLVALRDIYQPATRCLFVAP